MERAWLYGRVLGEPTMNKMTLSGVGTYFIIAMFGIMALRHRAELTILKSVQEDSFHHLNTIFWIGMVAFGTFGVVLSIFVDSYRFCKRYLIAGIILDVITILVGVAGAFYFSSTAGVVRICAYAAFGMLLYNRYIYLDKHEKTDKYLQRIRNGEDICKI
jgi:hypothetical protein